MPLKKLSRTLIMRIFTFFANKLLELDIQLFNRETKCTLKNTSTCNLSCKLSGIQLTYSISTSIIDGVGFGASKPHQAMNCFSFSLLCSSFTVLLDLRGAVGGDFRTQFVIFHQHPSKFNELMLTAVRQRSCIEIESKSRVVTHGCARIRLSEDSSQTRVNLLF